MVVGSLGLGALAAVGGLKAGTRAWDTIRQNRRVDAQQSELENALQQAEFLSEQVDDLQAENANLSDLADARSATVEVQQGEDALVAAIATQKDTKRRLDIMMARLEQNTKLMKTEQRLKQELIKMQITSQSALRDAQSLVQQLQATLEQREAKMAAGELVHAKHIKSWQTQVEMEEERAERMASSLRAELEEKIQKLKQEQKAGQFCSKALLQSLVDGYLQRVEHEEQLEELNSDWRKKQREWDLAADSLRHNTTLERMRHDHTKQRWWSTVESGFQEQGQLKAELQGERRARQEAEAQVATVKAQLIALEDAKVAEAEKHTQEMRTLESTLNAAHAGKQVLEGQHEEVKDSLLAAKASKTAVLRKLEKQSSSFKESLKAQVEAETKELATKVDQVKKEKTDLQKSQVELAEEYSKEKKEAKKEVKRLQAQLATSQKEKVDLADNHKVEVNALRDENHVLRAKQATPNLALESPKKSKPAKKKAAGAQKTATTTPPITKAEPSSAGNATNLLISIPTPGTPGPSGSNTGVYNTMEAVPDSPGPSVAPPSPDAVERSSRRGWRGVDLSSQDDTALSASFNWDEQDWQVVASSHRGFQRGFSRSGGRHQHQA